MEWVFICTAWKSPRVQVSRVWTPGEIWFRIFHPALLLQAFSLLSNHIHALLGSAPHLPSLSSLVLVTYLIFPGPLTGPREQWPSAVAELCCDSVPHCLHPIPELLLSLISYWLIASGGFLKVEPAQSIDLGGTLLRCFQKAGDNEPANSDNQLDLFFPTLQAVLGPCSFACWFVDLNQKLCFDVSTALYLIFFF